MKEAARRYYKSLPGSPAEEYLASRGLLGNNMFYLGVVSDPLPGHEMYRGMISIPYFRYSTKGKYTVASIRFRCINPECGVVAGPVPEGHKESHQGHGKYNTIPGDRPRLFNTISLQSMSEDVVITEGEFDAIAARYAGFEAVGVPGATSWQDHFREPFLGYVNVFILADGDDAGIRFGNSIAKQFQNAKVIVMPPKQDVNSFLLAEGPEALRERIYGSN